VRQVGFSDDGRVWVFSRGTSDSYVTLQGAQGEQSTQFSGWPHEGVMAEVTESAFGVPAPTGSVWAFDAQRPGLRAY
jgi:hypothetical protein